MALEDPKNVVMPQFANRRRWMAMSSLAETVAISFHSCSLIWAYPLTPMIRSTDMVDPEVFMKEESRGCDPGQLHDGTGRARLQQRLDAGRTALGLPGILLPSDKGPSVQPRDAECLQVFRMRPLRQVILMDYELQTQTGMQCLEAWLADK